MSSMFQWHEYVKILVGLLAIINPLLAVPAFIALTGDDTAQARRIVARRTASAVAVIIAVTVIAGQPLLTVVACRCRTR